MYFFSQPCSFINVHLEEIFPKSPYIASLDGPVFSGVGHVRMMLNTWTLVFLVYLLNGTRLLLHGLIFLNIFLYMEDLY